MGVAAPRIMPRQPSGTALLLSRAMPQPSLIWALSYENGVGLPQDHGQAVKWYRLAAAQGHVAAQFRLGVSYDLGQGVTQDYVEAIKWYRAAVAQGDAAAQNNLGSMYEYGLGVAQDYVEAVKWYQFSADQGYAKAQYNLGLMHANGRGVPPDFVIAHQWLDLAIEADPPLAPKDLDDATDNRDQIAARLAPEELAEAQRRVQEWLAAHPKP